MTTVDISVLEGKGGPEGVEFHSKEVARVKVPQPAVGSERCTAVI